MNIAVNHEAVFAAAVVSMIAGAVWYVLFAKALQRIRSLSSAEEKQLQKQAGIMYVTGFIFALVMAEILAHFVVMSESFSHLDPTANGMITALVAYIGFVVPVQVTHIIFGNYGTLGKKMKLFGINTGGQLVSLLVMGAILGAMS